MIPIEAPRRTGVRAMAMQLRGGWLADGASMRALRRAVLSVLVLLGGLAAPARSATIVEVRVGPHPAFTRVVFEMDEQSGYRVERQRLPDGSGELVVTIDAASQARSIRSRSPLIDVVSVEESLGRAVAHIRLSKGDLDVREMILTGPPRIVLDVMAPEQPVAAKTPPRPPEPEPPPEATVPEPVAVADVIPEPEPGPVVDVTPEPPPEPEPPAEAGVEAPVEPPAEIVTEEPEEALEVEPEELGEIERPGIQPETAPGTPGEPAEGVEPTVEEPEPVEVVDRPPARAPTPDGGGFELPFGITPLRAALAGLLLILAVAAVLIRRRSLPSDVDAAPFGEESGDDGEFGDHAAYAESAASAGFPPQTSDRGAGPGAAPEEAGPFGAPERGGSAMRSETHELPSQRSAAKAPPKFGGDEESDLMQIVHEMQKRMSHLESRLDESNAARERLERQVAAQSEELRVQRAAIARTQRALRGLARSEDEATEPALRDPAKANPGA
jgi:hypothetical protein